MLHLLYALVAAAKSSLKPQRELALENLVSLLKTPSSAQSLTFPCAGSSSPTLMRHLLYALLATARSSLKPQRELALENLALRQPLAILKRKTKRPKLTKADRAFWVALYSRMSSRRQRTGPSSIRLVTVGIITANISRRTTF